MVIDTVFFDVGGVLGSNGWDAEARAAAVRAFELNGEEYEYRHHDAVGPWEEGRISMDTYLDLTVFYQSRSFSRDEFRSFMLANSIPNVAMVDVARALNRSGQYRLMSLNNEAAELHEYRVRRFKLNGIFCAFLTSCYLGVRKPMPEFFYRALGIAQMEPARCVFIDDREQNLIAARALGINTILYTSPDDTCRRLATFNVLVSA